MPSNPAEREGLLEAFVKAWDSGAISLWTEGDIAPYRAALAAPAPREQEPPVHSDAIELEAAANERARKKNEID